MLMLPEKGLCFQTGIGERKYRPGNENYRGIKTGGITGNSARTRTGVSVPAFGAVYQEIHCTGQKLLKVLHFEVKTR